jgi:hypothetical protein
VETGFSFLELSRCIGHPDVIVDHFRMHCDTHRMYLTRFSRLHSSFLRFSSPAVFRYLGGALWKVLPDKVMTQSQPKWVNTSPDVMKVSAYALVVHQHGHQGCPLIALSRYTVTFCIFLKAVQIGLFMFFNIKRKI